MVPGIDQWSNTVTALIGDARMQLDLDVADQAELHGLLARIRDLGLELVAVDSGPAGK